ncbi:uncharacterized protein HfgLR_15220 [Haloferax gibbonsii]|uniref:Uncharacterized protein n=1 Tax=Haloferax gibbonsii TaxID=35746 RepID=A0A871BJA6_HALGI|nr:DUF6498-containing protein [Haloferax gibbonsii]QOS13171.1 uncharacterized protein HfgLR_15220 [Haloferax gibbonsii]
MRPPSPRDSGVLAVLASNAVAPVGVLFLDWSPTVLFGVFVAEIAAVLCWTLVKIPFAAKRPNNAIGDGDRLFGPLQAKRGGVSLPRSLPRFYPRNVPTLLIAAFLLVPLELAVAFVAFGLTDPVVTDVVAGQILLGGVSVFVGRGVETVTGYFAAGGYRDHSARSVLLPPFKLLFAVGLLLFVFGPFAIELENDVFLVILVGLKFLYDLRALQLERSETRGVFYRLYGSEETEIEPIPVEVPAGAPTYRTTPARSVALTDAVSQSLRYTVTSGVLWCYGVAAALVFFGAWTFALAPLALAAAFGTIRGTSRYLAYGPVEFRCYGDVLVAHDALLDEPQARLERDAVTDVSVSTDAVDRLFGTETIRFETGVDTSPDVGLTVPDPEEARTDDANANHPMTIPHVEDAAAVLDAFGDVDETETEPETEVETTVPSGDD